MGSGEDEEFLALLRQTFGIEAGEHLETIAAGLLQLERGEFAGPAVDVVFRAAHSLKGAAKAVDLTTIVALCQSLEDMFAGWKRRDGAPPAESFDAAHRALDLIRSAIDAAEAGAGFSDASSGAGAPPPEAAGPPSLATPRDRAALQDTVRVNTDKLDSRLAEAEEMLAVKHVAARRTRELRALAGHLRGWRRAWAAAETEVRGLCMEYAGAGASTDPPRPKRLFEFLAWSAECMKTVEHEAAVLSRSAEQDAHLVGKLVDDLLEDSKKLLVLPFSTISASFRRLVRDLGREQGKDVQFDIEGEDTEIDKRVLEEIKDPVVHLLRNAVDHGIEPPEVRLRAGKPARGEIVLAVSQVEGSKVQVLLSDDGAGIDAPAVCAVARRQGLATGRSGEPDDAHALIFHPEVTTSPMITQISGRGLGLAIVREKVEKLGGTVSVESRAGGGTVFRIVIPASRARFHGIVLEEAGRVMVVPTAQTYRVQRVRPDDLLTAEGRETITCEGAPVPLVHLAEVLELPPGRRHGDPDAPFPAVVLGTGRDRVAFAVDAVLDEQEVMLKPLRKPLSRVRNVGAATVLASGQVAPILNVSDLLRSARGVRGPTRRTSEANTAAVQSILVAEDSITSRMLLKSMLESAGYRVKVAADGMEAFTMLRTESFDLLVSDVEMPRLDGFALTERVRADRALADLPVVLVTALETREDRERGIDAGASAYIVKSGFEQSVLLDTVRRLI